MIYVAVGTQKFPFDRLLKSIDELVANGTILEDVFAQSGNCTYVPKNYLSKNFLSKDQFEENIEKCDLLITHSGVATMILGLKHKKPVIVIPRLAKYGEHVDDHQVQIAEVFAERNLVLKCCETDDLGELIAEAKSHLFSEYVSQKEEMIHTIREYIYSI